MYKRHSNALEMEATHKRKKMSAPIMAGKRASFRPNIPIT